MRTLLTIALTIFLSTAVFGTVQIPDKIIYKGKEYRLGDSYPLESYFAQYPDKRPKSNITFSALWRGYVAMFEIIDNQLFLKDIEIKIYTKNEKGMDESSWKSVLNEVFPNQELVKMDCFMGLLVLPYEEKNYAHREYDLPKEHYILLEIDKGKLKKERKFYNGEFKEFEEKQFQAFKKTEEYEKVKAELKKLYEETKVEYNIEYKDEDIDAHLRNGIIYYTSKILVEDDNPKMQHNSFCNWKCILLLISIIAIIIGMKYKLFRYNKSTNQQ